MSFLWTRIGAALFPSVRRNLVHINSGPHGFFVAYSTIHALAQKDENLMQIKENKLQIQWNGIKNAKSSHFHSEWLRFNCQCSKCRQPHSNQRLLDSNEIRQKLTLTEARLEGDELRLRWLEDSHDAFISLDWLRETEKYSELPTRKLEGSTLPRFDFEVLKSSEDSILSLYKKLLDDGFSIVYNLPTIPGTVKDFVETVFKIPVQRTIYGEIFDVISTPNPINVAYSNAELKPHIDLAYYESPPGLQLLHCLQFDDSVKGGESTLVDGIFTAEAMRKQYPQEFEVLISTPATFEKIHFDRKLPVWMRYRRPHIAVNHEKQITGLFWAPQFEGPLFAPLDQISEYYDAHRKFSSLIDTCSSRKEFRLKLGEMVVFNNRRMLHGRKAFSVDQGTRHFQGAYVHIDEFKSQAQVALARANQSISVPRVANLSY